MLHELAMKVQRGAARHYNSKPFRMQNRAPLVSFTFDDVPDTAYINGASILEDRGIDGATADRRREVKACRWATVLVGLCDIVERHVEMPRVSRVVAVVN